MHTCHICQATFYTRPYASAVSQLAEHMVAEHSPSASGAPSSSDEFKKFPECPKPFTFVDPVDVALARQLDRLSKAQLVNMIMKYRELGLIEDEMLNDLFSTSHGRDPIDVQLDKDLAAEAENEQYNDGRHIIPESW